MRGFRIELGEIEAALRRHPAVRGARRGRTRGARRARSGSSRVCGQAADRRRADERCAASAASELPDYMVPAVFVPLTRLPLTPNGKVDRAARCRRRTACRCSRRGASPRRARDVERAIAAVWHEVLGVDQVGGRRQLLRSRRPFAAAGAGRSRLLQDALGMPLSIVDLFQYPTVGSLAAHLRGSNRARLGRAAQRDAPRATRRQRQRVRVRRGAARRARMTDIATRAPT